MTATPLKSNPARDAFIGTAFSGTRKGTVAYFRVPAQSIMEGGKVARPAAVVFPEFKSGAPSSIAALGKASAFLQVAGNAFNYEVIGERGFRAVSALVRQSGSYALTYGDLGGAHGAIEEVMRMAQST